MLRKIVQFAEKMNHHILIQLFPNWRVYVFHFWLQKDISYCLEVYLLNSIFQLGYLLSASILFYVFYCCSSTDSPETFRVEVCPKEYAYIDQLLPCKRIIGEQCLQLYQLWVNVDIDVLPGQLSPA